MSREEFVAINPELSFGPQGLKPTLILWQMRHDRSRALIQSRSFSTDFLSTARMGREKAAADPVEAGF
ncbi:MAG: hypothetical protein ABSC76_04310 [Terracidiphilus sp.]|jgi:hypothetical protein